MLGIEEAGVDLELCVHAHGQDVDLLIEASFKINYSLGISSSYIWDLAFAIMVRTMFSFKYHFSYKLSTCLLQSNTPVQPLLWFVVEYYPPGISRLSWNCITFYEFFIKCYLPTDSNFSRAWSY